MSPSLPKSSALVTTSPSPRECYKCSYQILLIICSVATSLNLKCKSRIGPRKIGPSCIIPFKFEGEVQLQCITHFSPLTGRLPLDLLARPLCPIRRVHVVNNEMLTVLVTPLGMLTLSPWWPVLMFPTGRDVTPGVC